MPKGRTRPSSVRPVALAAGRDPAGEARQALQGRQPGQAHPQPQGPGPGRRLRPQAGRRLPAGGQAARPAGDDGRQDGQEPAGLQARPQHPDGQAADRPGRVQPQRQRRLLRLRAPGLRRRRGLRHRAAGHAAERPAAQQPARPGDLRPRHRQQHLLGARLPPQPLQQAHLHQDRPDPAGPARPDRPRRPARHRPARLHRQEPLPRDVQGRLRHHRRRRRLGPGAALRGLLRRHPLRPGDPGQHRPPRQPPPGRPAGGGRGRRPRGQ
jgi:hypothetical protein